MVKIGSDNLKVFLTAAAASFVGVWAYMKLAPLLHKRIPAAFEGKGGGAGA